MESSSQTLEDRVSMFVIGFFEDAHVNLERVRKGKASAWGGCITQDNY